MTTERKVEFYRLEGHEPVECDLLEWARSQHGDVTVARTLIGDVLVDTRFLGVGLVGREMRLFETLIFGGKLNGDVRREHTWVEAEERHQKVCDYVRHIEGQKP